MARDPLTRTGVALRMPAPAAGSSTDRRGTGYSDIVEKLLPPQFVQSLPASLTSAGAPSASVTAG